MPVMFGFVWQFLDCVALLTSQLPPIEKQFTLCLCMQLVLFEVHLPLLQFCSNLPRRAFVLVVTLREAETLYTDLHVMPITEQ
jgi:hypothetical protein